MTRGRVEIITSVQRRRRRSASEKRQVVAASLEPGASVSALACEAGIHASTLFPLLEHASGIARLKFSDAVGKNQNVAAAG
jgi:transposase-like protein